MLTSIDTFGIITCRSSLIQPLFSLNQWLISALIIITNNGVIHFNQKKCKRAIDFCERGLTLAKEIEVLKPQREACHCLYTTYKALGDGNNALEFLENINIIEDSIQILETTKSLQLMEFNRQVVADSLRVEDEKFQTQLEHEAEVKKKNRLNAIFIGPIVAGIVGVKKFQYDIWGDTINVASRMESHAGVGKVNISQNTYKYLKNDPGFAFEHRSQIAAKGKGNVEMYFVERRMKD